MPNQKVATAYHEAGHLVAAGVLGLRIYGATIVPNPEEGYNGQVRVPVEDEVRLGLEEDSYGHKVDEDDYLYRHLVVYFAGKETEKLFTGKEVSSSDPNIDLSNYGSDYYEAGSIILSLAGPNEDKQDELGKRAQKEAKALLRERWSAVEAVANALLKYEILDKGTCDQIMKEAIKGL
jgi:ATP-dependent Zn protease